MNLSFFQFNIGSVNRSILRLGGISGINTFISFINSLLVIHIFGVSREAEIYIAATLAVTNVDRLFNVGALSEILVPTFVRLREKEGVQVSMAQFSLICNWFFTVSLLVALVAILVAPFLLKTILQGFTDQEILITQNLFCLLCIFTPLKVLNGMCSIPFRAIKIYTVHERTGLINKLILTIALLTVLDSHGIMILVYSIILGIVMRTVYIFYSLRENDLHYFFILRHNRFNVVSILKKIYVPFVQVIGLQLGRWVELAALALLPPGGLATYHYAKKFYLSYYTFVDKTLNTVFLTEVASDNATPNFIKKHLLKSSFVAVVSLMLFIWVGQDLLSLAWGSEKFDHENLHVSYLLLIFFLATMLMTMIEGVYTRLNISRGDIAHQYFGSLFILTFCSCILYFGINHLGIVALFLVSILKAILNLAYASYLNYFRNPGRFIPVDYVHMVKLVCTLLIISFVFWMMSKFFLESIVFGSHFWVFFTVVIKVTVMSGLFLLLNRLFKLYSLRDLIND